LFVDPLLFLPTRLPLSSTLFPYTTLFRSGLYFFFQKDQTKEVMTELVQQNDIPAGGNKAVLTLGDGKRVILDGLNEGAVLQEGPDRKSTRLNSSHVKISYAVFCLKKKTQY